MDWVGVVEFALAACFDWASVMGDLMSLCSSDGTRSTQSAASQRDCSSDFKQKCKCKKVETHDVSEHEDGRLVRLLELLEQQQRLLVVAQAALRSRARSLCARRRSKPSESTEHIRFEGWQGKTVGGGGDVPVEP